MSHASRSLPDQALSKQLELGLIFFSQTFGPLHPACCPSASLAESLRAPQRAQLLLHASREASIGMTAVQSDSCAEHQASRRWPSKLAHDCVASAAVSCISAGLHCSLCRWHHMAPTGTPIRQCMATTSLPADLHAPAAGLLCMLPKASACHLAWPRYRRSVWGQQAPPAMQNLGTASRLVTGPVTSGLVSWQWVKVQTFWHDFHQKWVGLVISVESPEHNHFHPPPPPLPALGGLASPNPSKPVLSMPALSEERFSALDNLLDLSVQPSNSREREDAWYMAASMC